MGKEAMYQIKRFVVNGGGNEEDLHMEVMKLDLASLTSVQKFASKYKRKGKTQTLRTLVGSV
jgi:hypothetical protein